MTEPISNAQPRKQNTACDACRSRKVKCNKLPGQDKCQHCISKNYPCTHYVQQATSEKKRNTNPVRRPRNISLGSTSHTPPPQSSPAVNGTVPNIHTVPLPVRYGFYPSISLHTPTYDVLTYLFSPPESGNYLDWGEQAYKLATDPFKIDLALDLVEVFFQIVHVRQPLLNPDDFRHRLHLSTAATAAGSPSDQQQLLHPALVATVVAWGAKFSEHPLIASERQRLNCQSPFARVLVDRARELAEALRVHRVASSDHIIIALLLEPLQSQTPDDPTGFQGFWIHNALRHLLDLQYNHRSTMLGIQDMEFRGSMVFAWWMACLCDAFGAAYYRRKPLLDNDDYDIDFYTADPVTAADLTNPNPPASSREQLEVLGYYRAAHALAVISRSMARQFFDPKSDSEGLPYQAVLTFTQQLRAWRDQYLASVGVPSNFEAQWDFVAAVSACSSDATFHIMWIILFNSLDSCGVKELNAGVATEGMQIEIEALQQSVMDEALHGALRIAGLTGVLTSNGYLKLDPAVMHVSINQAGTLLARLGRPEVSNCIGGLDQYRYSYEETGDQSEEMKRVYQASMSGDVQLNHMLSFALAVMPGQQHRQFERNGNGNSMAVDMGGGAGLGSPFIRQV